MELKQVAVINKGMSRDVAINQESQEYAFCNKNIRIQALDNSTLMSITNFKGPLRLSTNVDTFASPCLVSLRKYISRKKKLPIIPSTLRERKAKIMERVNTKTPRIDDSIWKLTLQVPATADVTFRNLYYINDKVVGIFIGSNAKTILYRGTPEVDYDIIVEEGTPEEVLDIITSSLTMFYRVATGDKTDSNKEKLYCWKNYSTGYTVYTKSENPSVSDTIYNYIGGVSSEVDSITALQYKDAGYSEETLDIKSYIEVTVPAGGLSVSIPVVGYPDFEDGLFADIIDPTNTTKYQEQVVTEGSGYFYYYGIKSLSSLDKEAMKISTVTTIDGVLVGKCISDDYLVLFIHNQQNHTDYIYRVDMKVVDNTLNVLKLYEGDLNFNVDYPLDTLYYIENEKVQKVYFTDGLNSPRVINIMVDYTYPRNSFEFYPKITKFPKFDIIKDFGAPSELPSGVIQYFASYFNYNGAETLIANSSCTFTIDYEDRGASPEETGCCAFKITLTNVDTTFDYLRIYSAIRTSKDGPVQVHIVKDIEIDKTVEESNDKEYTFIDGGINQEQLDPNQLLYIGGTPFIAKTLAEKDGTLFFGNIKTHRVDVVQDLSNWIKANMVNSEHKSRNVEFTRYAGEALNDPITGEDTGIRDMFKSYYPIPNYKSTYYPYRTQTVNSSINYKTFKAGETYRFGIQFQTKQGQWTSVTWIGDKVCKMFPRYNPQANALYLNNAVFKFPEGLKAYCGDYANYRIVMADPEGQNGRKIQAQGVVCPTLFTPGQRALNAPYALPSWVMRPRNGEIACHHFEPIQANNELTGAELISAQTDKDGNYPKPYFFEKRVDSGDISLAPKYLVSFLCLDSPHEYSIKSCLVRSWDADTNFFGNRTQVKVLYDDSDKGAKDQREFLESWDTKLKENGIDTRLIPSNSLLETAQKKISSAKWKEALCWIGCILLIAVAIVLAVVSWGSMAPLSAGLIISAVSLVGIVGGLAGIYGGIEARRIVANAYGMSVSEVEKAMKEIDKLEGWQKEFLAKGFMAVSTGNADSIGKIFSNTLSTVSLKDGEVCTFPSWLKPSGFDRQFGSSTDKHAISFIQIVDISDDNFKYSSEITNNMNNYFVDESLVTFHAPNLENLSIGNSNLKFRIVGTVPIDTTYSECDLLAGPSYMKNAGLIHEPILKRRGENKPLYSDFLYLDADFKHVHGEGISDAQAINLDIADIKLLTYDPALYKLYLWDKDGSIIGATVDSKLEADGEGSAKAPDPLPSILQEKTFYNHLFSTHTDYFKSSYITYVPSKVQLFTGTPDSLMYNVGGFGRLYNGNYDNVIIKEDTNNNSKPLSWSNKSDYENRAAQVNPLIDTTTRIRFSSDVHAVFDLNKSSASNKVILPYFENGTEMYRGLSTRKEKFGEGWSANHSLPSGYDLKTCWVTSKEIGCKDCYFIHFSSTVSLHEFHYTDTTAGVQMLTDLLNGLSIVDKFNLLKYYRKKLPIIIGWDLHHTTMAYEEHPPKNHHVYLKVRIAEIHWNKPTDEQDGYFSDLRYALYDGDNEVYVQKGAIPSMENRVTYSRGGGLKPYTDFPVVYNVPKISENVSLGDTPYLFIGELYYDIPDEELYGGYSESNLKDLTWYPISPITPIGDDVHNMEGDTYYQRWDCLKTFPTTENDFNKVVDITSFMVETHENLDGRYDINRGNFNMFVRPTNFNKMNPVYSQKNTLFTYQTKYNEFESDTYPNEVTWSLSKNYLAEVDSWTNITVANITHCKHPITKLVNFADKLLALTKHSVEMINFNAKNMIATSDSSFIELANSNKVDGTLAMQSHQGTTNPSVCITERGMYFIDDNEKSLVRIGANGEIDKIGFGKMDSWFKQNVVPGEYKLNNQSAYHLEYDAIHKDLYLVNGTVALMFNEPLNSFTSFVDYQDCQMLYSYNGELYAVGHLINPKLYRMFDGLYNRTFDGVITDYSVEYRLSPDPYNDKVFTNVEFLADCFNNYGLSSTLPFTHIRALDEYQDTLEKPLTFVRDYKSSLQKKFRIWRADIPRDANSRYGRDRIRNPWINLKLERKNTLDSNSDELRLYSTKLQYMI